MEPARNSARFRLLLLWVSQVARVVADSCLRIFVVLGLAQGAAAERDSAWHLVTACLAVTAIFLSPLNGALCNTLPKRGVLVGSAAYCLGVVLLFGLLDGPWLLAWALLAVGALIYSPTRYALLPAAANDTGIPLTRINGWIEMGAVGGLILGMVLGGLWYGQGLPRAGVAVPVAIAGGWSVLSLLSALLVSFPSDVRRPEAPTAALAGFFRDCGRLWRDAPSRSSLLGLACLRGLVVAITGAVVACVLGREGLEEPSTPVLDLVWAGLWILAGVAAGSLLAGVQGHPYRSLGLIPLGALGLLAGLIPAAVLAPNGIPPWLCVVLGVMGGLVNVPLAATYQASVPADARGNAMAVRNLAEYLCMTLTSILFLALSRTQWVSPSGQLWLLAAMTAVAAAVAFRTLLRPLLEMLLELVIWPLYRIRGHGPGFRLVPPRGPIVVIANHSSYLDPLWVGKVLPRGLVPMMTSVFFDRPGLRWLMVHVVRAIRVQAATFRREVPELGEAVAVLDRGGCLVVFPEGMLRRRDDQPVRQFGQGVWRILLERPQTPVFVCWIEGGWGSYFSYRGGPPGKNKPMDWRRPIDIAMAEPVVLDLELLADHRAARSFLMQRCLETRQYLGLEPLLTKEMVDEEVEQS